jgi:glycerol 3-phosphatase-2
MGVGESPGGHHLTVMSTETAFEAYESVRNRLPVVRPSAVGFQRVATLADIADVFDVFLLDAFGVLNIGEAASRISTRGADGEIQSTWLRLCA